MPPVVVNAQDLAYLPKSSTVVDPQQDDRQIAGDAVRPQKR